MVNLKDVWLHLSSDLEVTETRKTVFTLLLLGLVTTLCQFL